MGTVPERFRRWSLILGILGSAVTLAIVGLLYWDRYANDLNPLESERETLAKLQQVATPNAPRAALPKEAENEPRAPRTLTLEEAQGTSPVTTAQPPSLGLRFDDILDPGRLTVEELGRRVKQKYPGTYDDLTDVDVGRAVKFKFPGAYDDFVDTGGKYSVLESASRLSQKQDLELSRIVTQARVSEQQDRVAQAEAKLRSAAISSAVVVALSGIAGFLLPWGSVRTLGWAVKGFRTEGPIREFLLLAVVGFVLWLFLVAVIPLPHRSGARAGGAAWGTIGERNDPPEVMLSFISCVFGLPAGVMAIRRLRKL